MKAGVWPLEDNPLVNAPHIQSELVAEWAHPYSREAAVFPAGVADKYRPTVKRLMMFTATVTCSAPAYRLANTSNLLIRLSSKGASAPFRLLIKCALCVSAEA